MRDVIKAMTPADRIPARAPLPLITPKAAPRLIATKLTVSAARICRNKIFGWNNPKIFSDNLHELLIRNRITVGLLYKTNLEALTLAVLSSASIIILRV